MANAASRLGSICGGRKLGAKSIGFDFAALPGWRAAQWVDDLVGAADLVIIDAASHAEAYVRITARAARLVAVPVQPSPLRSWATARFAVDSPMEGTGFELPVPRWQ